MQYKTEPLVPTSITIELKLIFKSCGTYQNLSCLQAKHRRYKMAYIVKSIVILCAGVLLLLVAHSSASPLPARDPRSSDSMCRIWQLDTNLENNSVTQVLNGISVFNAVTPNQGVVDGQVCTSQLHLLL